MSQDSIKFTSSFHSDTSVNTIIPSPQISNKKTIPFWSENPNVLFQSEYIMEFFPVNSMTFSQSLNAISRSILVLSLVAFILTKNASFILVMGITLYAIHFYFTSHMNEIKKNQTKQIEEGFDSPGLEVINNPEYTRNRKLEPEVFDTTKSSNPFSNVLLPDYEYNPNKKPAPPSYAANISQDILKQAKQTVNELNPDQPNIADKLFKDLGEQLEFEQSMRNFYSTPNTTIPNDQAAFAEFCYGSMISCKEGNLFACARNLDRHTN
jgi:hypothetical protein